MTNDRPSLADAFSAPKAAAAPDRTAGLGGLLPPKRTASAPSVPAQSPKAAKLPAATAKTPSAPTATKPKPKSAESGGAVSNVAVYLEGSLLDRVKTTIREKGITYDALLVEVFDAVGDEAIAKTFVNEGAGSSTMPTRQRRRRGEPGIQIQVRLDETQKQWLAEKAGTVGAPSRSALVAAAFRLYLD